MLDEGKQEFFYVPLRQPKMWWGRTKMTSESEHAQEKRAIELWLIRALRLPKRRQKLVLQNLRQVPRTGGTKRSQQESSTTWAEFC